MGWRPDDFWQASLPEVMGAIVGDYNRHVENLKMAWEPARYIAFLLYQTAIGKKSRLKTEMDLRLFPWEKRQPTKAEARAVIQSVMSFRGTVRDRWGLKYYGE